MKSSLLTLLLTVVVLNAPTMACMNDYVPNVAAIERSKSILDQLQKHTEAEPWTVRRDRLRKELAAGGDYKVKNDLATALAHTGEAAEAVTLLEEIETEKPGLYATAANLGTAYELSGDDEKALLWIRAGIARNPDAHEGTEWLHVRILEAKLAQKKDPEWLANHSIVDAEKPAAAPELSAFGNRGEVLTEDQIKSALIYQLHERMQFVSPPDAVVGALLIELVERIRDEPLGAPAALDVLRLAKDYLWKLPNLETLQAITDSVYVQAQMRIPSERTKHDIPMLTTLAIIGALLSTLAVGLKRLVQRKWLAPSS